MSGMMVHPSYHLRRLGVEGLALPLVLLALALLSALGLGFWGMIGRAHSEVVYVVHYNQAYYLAEGAAQLAIDEFARTGARNSRTLERDPAASAEATWPTADLVSSKGSVQGVQAAVNIRLAPQPPGGGGGECRRCEYRVVPPFTFTCADGRVLCRIVVQANRCPAPSLIPGCGTPGCAVDPSDLGPVDCKDGPPPEYEDYRCWECWYVSAWIGSDGSVKHGALFQKKVAMPEDCQLEADCPSQNRPPTAPADATCVGRPRHRPPIPARCP